MVVARSNCSRIVVVTTTLSYDYISTATLQHADADVAAELCDGGNCFHVSQLPLFEALPDVDLFTVSSARREVHILKTPTGIIELIKCEARYF